MMRVSQINQLAAGFSRQYEELRKSPTKDYLKKEVKVRGWDMRYYEIRANRWYLEFSRQFKNATKWENYQKAEFIYNWHQGHIHITFTFHALDPVKVEIHNGHSGHRHYPKVRQSLLTDTASLQREANKLFAEYFWADTHELGKIQVRHRCSKQQAKQIYEALKPTGRAIVRFDNYEARKLKVCEPAPKYEPDERRALERKLRKLNIFPTMRTVTADLVNLLKYPRQKRETIAKPFRMADFNTEGDVEDVYQSVMNEAKKYIFL